MFKVYWTDFVTGNYCTLNLFAEKSGKLVIRMTTSFRPLLGGSDELSNLRVMCQHCNTARGNVMTIAELVRFCDTITSKVPNGYHKGAEMKSIFKSVKLWTREFKELRAA